MIHSHHMTAALAEQHRNQLLTEAAHQRLVRAGRSDAAPPTSPRRWLWRRARASDPAPAASVPACGGVPCLDTFGS